MASTAELVSCRAVSVVHHSGSTWVPALKQVDFHVKHGESVALFGRSGSGKTTLLHVLGGLIVPNDGQVSWKGEPLSALDAQARARRRATGIAFVFQGANLLPTFTAYENVAFAANAAESAVNGNGHAPHNGNGNTPHGENGSVHDPAELLNLVGLGAKLDALPSELSGGEAQRVAIARALAQRPALMLCDEPTGHLDSDTGTRVLDLVDALQAQFSFALVTATHDADVAARAQRAVGLADGRVTEELVLADGHISSEELLV